MMVWFEVTGFGVALLLTGTWFGPALMLTGTWSTLLVSVSLGSVARHLRPRSSISTSSKKTLGGSSSLSKITSLVSLVVFDGPETVVVVVVVVVVAAAVEVGTVAFPVVTVLHDCRLSPGDSWDSPPVPMPSLALTG